MSFTLSLISNAINSTIPFADRLPFIGNAQQRQRKSTQRSVNFANYILRNPQSNTHLEGAAKKILAEANYNRTAYAQAQIIKLALPADLLVPGAGTILTAATTVGTIVNTQQFGAQNGYLSKSFLKKAGYVIFSVGATLCAPVVTPLLTPVAIGVVAAGTIATAVTADILSRSP